MAAPSIFLLVFLSMVTLSLAGVNIDCGTSTSGVDENNIKWVGDKDFVTTGVSSTVFSTIIEKAHTTLRYFPTGESNCYSNIPVTKGGKVLVRTMFYYGNYDGKLSSPSFDVMFDGKHRDTIFIFSAFNTYISEMIFFPTSGETNVCFVRTSSSNPFVSSIEVVDLASGMYDELGPGEGLLYRTRMAYGTLQFLRSDLHGRLWVPSEPNFLYTVMASLATSIDTSDASNNPPESVLQHSWAGPGLVLGDPTLPSSGVPVYLAMYFSDPLETSSLRSFNIFFGGRQVNKSPVVPVFGKTIQVVVRDVVASSTTLLEFRSTASSFFPPLINALELYVISKATSGGGGGNGGGGGGGGGGSGNSGGGDGGGDGGGSGGSGGGGSGRGGSGGTGGSNEASSGGSTNNAKKSKLPIIIGVLSAVAFVIIAYAVIAIVVANRRRARLQALETPNVVNMETGPSPLPGQQMGHDSNQPANEIGMGEINDPIGVNQSYVNQ